jgi:hypothetical protein
MVKRRHFLRVRALVSCAIGYHVSDYAHGGRCCYLDAADWMDGEDGALGQRTRADAD